MRTKAPGSSGRVGRSCSQHRICSKPLRDSRCSVSSGPANVHGEKPSSSGAVCAAAAAIASRTRAMLPRPPHWISNRPPGRRRGPAAPTCARGRGPSAVGGRRRRRPPSRPGRDRARPGSEPRRAPRAAPRPARPSRETGRSPAPVRREPARTAARSPGPCRSRRPAPSRRDRAPPDGPARRRPMSAAVRSCGRRSPRPTAWPSLQANRSTSTAKRPGSSPASPRRAPATSGGRP